MGLAQMGLAIKTKLKLFCEKWIRSQLDANNEQMTHTLHAPNRGIFQHVPKPLGPWAMKTRISGQISFYIFLSF